MNAKEFNKHLKNVDNRQQSFIELYEEYYSKIVLHISVKFDYKIAHDIAHDFFCKLVNGQFKDAPYIESPVAWIYRVCDNMAVNVYKKEARYVSISEYEFTDDSQDMDRVLDIKRLLECLDDFERKIVYFHFFEGYTLKELACRFSINYDNFRKKYGVIMKKLRKYGDLFTDRRRN